MTVIPVCQCRSKRCGHPLGICTRVANAADGLCTDYHKTWLSEMFEAIKTVPIDRSEAMSCHYHVVR
jgi:hypothetical protein